MQRGEAGATGTVLKPVGSPPQRFGFDEMTNSDLSRRRLPQRSLVCWAFVSGEADCFLTGLRGLPPRGLMVNEVPDAERDAVPAAASEPTDYISQEAAGGPAARGAVPPVGTVIS